MCLDYEWKYNLRRAEEARKAMDKIEEELRKPKPAAPAAAPASKPKDTELVPV